jgi:signal recognition particle receptor subunit beta
MRHALVAVLGHVDHGKSALVRALTGTETDRLREERERGISIVLGFARLALPDAAIDLVDVPGHERFVRAMVAGATAMRAALLVVDAAEGVRAQTVEHAEIAALLGIRRGIVAVTRADRAAPEEAARAAEAARRLLRDLALGDWPVVVTSAVTGRGLTRSRRRSARWPSRRARRPGAGLDAARPRLQHAGRGHGGDRRAARGRWSPARSWNCCHRRARAHPRAAGAWPRGGCGGGRPPRRRRAARRRARRRWRPAWRSPRRGC